MMDVRQGKVQIDIVMDSSVSSKEGDNPDNMHSPCSILENFNSGYFRISLSLCSQSLLWKSLGRSPSVNSIYLFLRIFRLLPSTSFVLLWSVSLCAHLLLSFFYLFKCFFHPTMVKNELRHRVGVNYLYAPWISWLLLLESCPFISVNSFCYMILWWTFTVPILALDIKIYGHWFTNGKRYLSEVANPTSQISVIGNLVSSKIAAEMGWKELSLWLFSVGIAHYLVLFVTLYQRLPCGHRLPAKFKPAFFLFFAAPSMASLTWKSISGKFDTVAKMFFFLSLFLFFSLVSRPSLFKKSFKRFHITWWAYSFPLTLMALASTEYARRVEGRVTHGLMVILLVISNLVLLILMVFTVLSSAQLFPKKGAIPSSSL